MGMQSEMTKDCFDMAEDMCEDRSDFFAAAAAESNEELQCELNEMMGECSMMAESSNVGMGAISAPQACMSAASSAPSYHTVTRKEKKSLPAFNSIIFKQSTDGFWKEDVRSILNECFENANATQSEVRSAIQACTLSNGVELETVYLTLLAIHILQECYEDNRGEWNMIVQKARTWLVQVGVAKPNNLLKKFTMATRSNPYEVTITTQEPMDDMEARLAQLMAI